MIPKFKAKIENGIVRLADKQLFSNHCSGLKNGEYFIVIDREKNKRSDSQNKYLWGVVYKIPADSLGWDIEDMHEFCKLKFNIIHKRIKDNEVELPGSTAILTIAQFIEYTDKIKRFFAEFDIYIPDPNEYLDSLETEETLF